MEASRPENSPAAALPAGAALGYDPAKPLMTGQDLLDSPLIGLWDEDEDRDSPVIARELRERNQRRDWS